MCLRHMPGISWICIREIDFDTYNICGESGIRIETIGFT